MSTTRRTGKGGRVAESYPVPMSVKRFQDVLHKVGLGEDEDWVNASEGDFEQAIDDALLEVRFLKHIKPLTKRFVGGLV